VLAELGLLGCKDTLIGNEAVRGVSGGEKRRVSIGVHLIDNPMLVFLDEPTSGLDSFQALAVMDTLKTMAAKADRTVVASIHQPRSSIYSMLDMIMLLSLGRTIYYGKAGKDCAAYFHGHGGGAHGGVARQRRAQGDGGEALLHGDGVGGSGEPKDVGGGGSGAF